MGIATCFLSRDGYTKGHQDQGKGNGTEGGDVLKVYLDLVVLLNFAVNYGLLRATAQLTGARQRPGDWEPVPESALYMQAPVFCRGLAFWQATCGGWCFWG